MVMPRRKVDPEFRAQEWHYLHNAVNSEQSTFEAKAGCTWKDCVPHPAQPGVIITLQSDNCLRTLDLKTGASHDLFQLDGQIALNPLAVSHDASLVAVLELLASKRGASAHMQQIAVWNLATREKTTLAKTPISGRGLLEFSPDGRKVMKVCHNAKAGMPDAGLSMSDVETGKILWHRPCDALPYDAEFDPKSGLVQYASNTEMVQLNAGEGLPTQKPPLALQGTSSTMPVVIKALHVFRTSGPNLRHYVGGKTHFDVRLPGNLVGFMNLAVFHKDGCFAACPQYES